MTRVVARARWLSGRPWQGGWGMALLLLLGSPWGRAALEASMWRHMLLQASLLLLAGALCAAWVPARARGDAIARWNAHGIAGLLGAGLVLSLLMVPRVLDLALLDVSVELTKFALLWAAGAALRLSWSSAGLIVQGFFLGNVLPMMAVAGQLYADSPVRICNAYLLDDQARLGHWLIGLACVAAVLWLAQVARRMVMRDAQLERAQAQRVAGNGW